MTLHILDISAGYLLCEDMCQSYVWQKVCMTEQTILRLSTEVKFMIIFKTHS